MSHIDPHNELIIHQQRSRQLEAEAAMSRVAGSIPKSGRRFRWR